VLPFDPTADRARRAWVACPNCDDRATCATCVDGDDCLDHWRYLLANRGPLVHLQCPSCAHLWSWDSSDGQAAGGSRVS